MNWASHAPKGAAIVVTNASSNACRQATRPLHAKPKAENSAVTPLRKRLSGWISCTRSAMKNAKNGTAAKATPSPTMPETTESTNKPAAMTNVLSIVKTLLLVPAPNGQYSCPIRS